MFVYILLAAFIYSVIFIIKQKWKYRSLNHFPGPVPLPILGSVLEFGNNPVDRHKNLIRVSNKYGPILTLWIGPNKPYLLTSDPDLTEFILSSPKHLKKSVSYNLLKPWLSNGLLLSTGSHWQKRRKVITPGFHFKILDEFLPTFISNADILIERLNNEIDNNVFNIYPYICEYALDNICETAMGTKVHAQKYADNEYPRAVKGLCALIANQIFSSWRGFGSILKFSEEYKMQRYFLSVLHGFTKSVIEERKQNLQVDAYLHENINVDEFGIQKKVAFLDHLLKARISGKPLSNDAIREEVDTFMFEGHDTTASAISFALYELARHPEIQKTLVKEYHELFGNESQRQLTQTDLSQMKYCELVIKETLRLYPSVPYFGRELTEDSYYNGILIPKGVHVFIFASYMHRRPELFKNPESFYPERFLPGSKDTKHPFAYIPFSAGPRNCIGQKFAMNEIKITLYKILSNFEVFPADKKHDVILSFEIILKSANGVSVILKKRT